ncbi:hypothetical protein J4733_07740 [Klebsiella pneumoniae]|uniref:Uncharacterized protein n=1 Tax=Klebsiella pneumoniae TaxID=573 RepID=A0A939SPD3_KLEPN|nr:hypothetical protein [Klebsiella pneumoniae]
MLRRYKSERYLRESFCRPDGDAGNFKTCQKCAEARDWLLNETDWPDDIDGDGHSYFFTMLRDHLREQGREGDRKYAFRAYRFVVLMDKRRMAYANAYNAEAVKTAILLLKESQHDN